MKKRIINRKKRPLHNVPEEILERPEACQILASMVFLDIEKKRITKDAVNKVITQLMGKKETEFYNLTTKPDRESLAKYGMVKATGSDSYTLDYQAIRKYIRIKIVGKEQLIRYLLDKHNYPELYTNFMLNRVNIDN